MATSAEKAGARAAEVLAPESQLFADADPVLFGAALGQAATAAVRSPGQLAGALGRYGSRLLAGANEVGLAALGRTRPAVDDRRYADLAWQSNPWFVGWHRAWAATTALLADLSEVGDLDPVTRQKAQFAIGLLSDALAPTNYLATNPVALKRAFETFGHSVLRGLGNMAEDVRHNKGRPRQVDTSPFELGRNLAATPGQVVYEGELMELIQYAPQTDEVHQTPILLSPPWINKYYVMDLAPGRSFAEWAVQHGHTVFAISYRQPDAQMRGTRMDDYLLHGPHQALDVMREITGSEQAHIVGLCLGGALTAMLIAWLEQTDPGRVASATLLNTMIDFSEPGPLGTFTDTGTVERLERKMAAKGYLEGGDMSGTFDVLRANDLIFNYVVSGWLLGEPPPAFDILAWNADSTRMPAAMHAFYLRSCYLDNEFAHGDLELAGRLLSPKDIGADVFVVAAENDHIVPWTSSYKTSHLVKGDVTFVLSSAGHIAGIVNPPGPKAKYWIAGELPTDPQAWRAAATEHKASWWLPWADWAAARGGALVPPPGMGSTRYPGLRPAPGRFVVDK